MPIPPMVKLPAIALAAGGVFGVSSGLKGLTLHGFDPDSRTSPGKMTTDELGTAVGITGAAAGVGALVGHQAAHLPGVTQSKAGAGALFAAALVGAFLTADAYAS